MNNSKKYWLIKKWVLILLKEGPFFKVDFKKTPDYWVLYIGRFILSNNVIDLNKNWGNI